MKRRWLQGVLWSCALCTGPALADGPRPFADFSFKSVSLPAPGQGPRIGVQIDPEEQAALLARPNAMLAAAPAQPEAPDAPLAGQDASGQAGPNAAFWGAVPVSLESAGAASFPAALAALGQAGVSAPRLQALQEIATAHGVDILKATIGTRVSPALALAVISVESAGRADAESGAGAKGLMQLIPATAERFGVSDTGDAGENIRGGVAYLDWLLDAFNQDLVLALAGYNAGENAVRDAGGVPEFAETRAYVPKVLAAWQVARGLCLTPPELFSDGCVFAVKGRPADG